MNDDHPLCRLRVQCNLSQKSLANGAGVSERTVMRAEAGHSIYPSSRQLLCDYFTRLFGRKVSAIELGLVTYELMETEDMDRRELLRNALLVAGGVLAVPGVQVDIERLVRVFADPAALDVPTIEQIAAIVDACWAMSNESKVAEVQRVLPVYLPHIVSLAHQTTKYQRRAAHLASQAYILSAEVERSNVHAMKAYCQQAVLYGDVAENADIQVAALKQQATILLIDKKPFEALQVYQRALPLIPLVTTLLRSRVYLGLASASARCGQNQDALRYLGLARENFPRYPEDDPNFLYTVCGVPVLHLYEALTYTDLHQPNDAWVALMCVDGLRPKMSVPESTRIEFVNLQARTAAERGDMELSRSYLQASVAASSRSGYTIWLEEAYEVYMEMMRIWPDEQRVKELVQLFH